MEDIIMRRNQVTLKIERFGDEFPIGRRQIEVYCDSNNLFEALMAATAQVLEEVRKYENVPSFGRLESETTEK
jgi:hypothetical protein